MRVCGGHHGLKEITLNGKHSLTIMSEPRNRPSINTTPKALILCLIVAWQLSREKLGNNLPKGMTG